MTKRTSDSIRKNYYRDLTMACCEIDEKHKEFERMAIQALSQEPCTDAVSREAVLNIASLHTLTVNESVEAIKKLPPVNPQPCDDAISDIMGISKRRTHDIMENELRCVQRASCGGCDRECGECPLLMDDKEIIKAYGYVIRMLELPPVTPSRPKGHWIAVYQGDEIINYRCSECELGDTNGSTNLYGWDYCRRCGAKMVEPQERSDKE